MRTMTTRPRADHARDQVPKPERATAGPSKPRTPILHPTPTLGRILGAGALVVATVVAWLALIVHTVALHLTRPDPHPTLLVVAVLTAITLLLFSALTFLVARLAALLRILAHHRAGREELDDHFDGNEPPLTILVPSYSEEPRVVRNTLLSAALQEYPNLRVVLLLDDPPNPVDPAAAARLDETRRLVAQIGDLLAERHSWIEGALYIFEAVGEPSPGPDDVRDLATLHDDAAHWLERMATRMRREDHADAFLADEVLLGLARSLREAESTLRSALLSGDLPSGRRLLQLHNRLLRIFSADLTVFERKAYASLSHEANKAMNLNSYLSLMGEAWTKRHHGVGTVLVPAPPGGGADLVVPDADYVLTLDADSMLLPEYCLRLVHHLEQPGNERVAIAQTPYCAYPGAPTTLERIAGATTDLQHIQHQGRTWFGATFWVGANAVIRKNALRDIVEVRTEGGFLVNTYIQDRTVIEDTESSVDLRAEGWTLYNHPERLSYSATPPDFGSLVVQRRRWANGGLIILPKFVATAWRARRTGVPLRLGEVALRVDYLASTAWSTLVVAALLGFHEVAAVLSPLALVAALPYFAAQASDLKQAGYRRSDVVRVYGLNLLLVPVNAAGVLKSLEQALTRRKIPFARTPKVVDRTATPPLYAVLPIVLLAVLLHAASEHVRNEMWGGLAFAVTTAIIVVWGILSLVGVRSIVEDVRAMLAVRLGGPAARLRRGRATMRTALRRSATSVVAPWRRLGLRSLLSPQVPARHASA